MATVHNNNAFAEKLVAMGRKLSLSEEKFEEVSLQAAQELKSNPSLYKTKVIWLSVLGYTFIFSIIGVFVWIFLATAGWLISSHHIYSIKLLFVMGALLLVMFKALWVKIEPPVGESLHRKDAPELFAMLDDLSKRLNTRVDKVLVDGSFNAAVVQVPKLGLFGMYDNYLLLGLPLMLTQSADQYRAVLAHELGHLSGNHSRSSAWIYNLRKRWSQLLTAFSDEASLFFFAPFYLFFSWFSSRFNAYTLALARAHEMEADENAVKIAGIDNFSESMLLLPLYGKLVEEKFWKTVFDRSKSEALPPMQVFNYLIEYLRATEINAVDLEKTIKEHLEQKGSGADSHPPLRTRLFGNNFKPLWEPDSSFSVPPQILSRLVEPVTLDKSAAQTYLGKQLPVLIESTSTRWQSAIAPYWTYQHQVADAVRNKLNTLIESEQKAPLTMAQLKEKAGMTEYLYDLEAAMPVYRSILEQNAEDSLAHQRLAVYMLDKSDDRGLEHIDKAIAANFNATASLAPVAIQYLQKQGRQNDVVRFESLLKEHAQEAELARKERNSVSGNSPLLPHGLDQATIDYLFDVFVTVMEIEAVWATRLDVRHLPDCPYLILGVEVHIPGLGEHSDQKLALAKGLLQNLQLDDEFCVVTFDLMTAKLKKRMQEVPGSRIYRRGVN